jgi:hypothetical protein
MYNSTDAFHFDIFFKFRMDEKIVMIPCGFCVKMKMKKKKNNNNNNKNLKKNMLVLFEERFYGCAIKLWPFTWSS